LEKTKWKRHPPGAGNGFIFKIFAIAAGSLLFNILTPPPRVDSAILGASLRSRKNDTTNPHPPIHYIFFRFGTSPEDFRSKTEWKDHNYQLFCSI
jgi:hypothetical protein